MDRIEREIEIRGSAVAADVLAELKGENDALVSYAELLVDRVGQLTLERDALAAELAAIKAEVPGLLDKLIRAATYLYSGWTPAEAAPHWADVDAAIDLAARLRGEGA